MSSSIPKAPPLDPELAAALNALPFQSISVTKEALPAMRAGMMPLAAPEVVLTDPGIVHEERMIPGPAGELDISILRSKTSAGGPRPAFYFLHGGGMIFGGKLSSAQLVFRWITELDLVGVFIEYRLAPEHPDPGPVQDCYAGLKWIFNNASELGIDKNQIMIAGQSAGGGLAAGTALMARDDPNGPKLVAQCLICPMLDDRLITTSSKQFMDSGLWPGNTNKLAWDMLLPNKKDGKDVSIYAAPARATDLSGLPPTWVDVGGAELFRDEDIAYATKLWESGIDTELHVWPGAWHAFDAFAPTANLSQLALDTRFQWVKRIFSRQAKL